MFTGLIERLGTVTGTKIDNGMLELEVATGAEPYETCLGASIAINGTCLTVTQINGQHLRFDVSEESLNVTNLGQLKIGDNVNLERALTLATRLGGHLVSGHVDGLGEITAVEPGPAGWLFRVQIPANLSRYLIPKGSICLDGVSLTINELKDNANGSNISLMLIPTTLNETTFGSRQPGWQCHVEVDMIGKYLERLNSYN